MRGRAKLNAGLTAAELVDDLCLTLSPRLAGGGGDGLLGGWLSRSETGGERLIDLGLVHVLEENSFLFLRLRPNYGPQL